jgi:hypothetical protein
MTAECSKTSADVAVITGVCTDAAASLDAKVSKGSAEQVRGTNHRFCKGTFFVSCYLSFKK